MWLTTLRHPQLMRMKIQTIKVLLSKEPTKIIPLTLKLLVELNLVDNWDGFTLDWPTELAATWQLQPCWSRPE